MLSLYDLILENQHLKFVDGDTGIAKSLHEIDGSLGLDNQRGLAFVYNNNDLWSVEVFLNFYKSNNAVVFLGRQLLTEYKAELERRYRPGYIYDPSRTEILGYILRYFSNDVALFVRQANESLDIHPRIKLLLSTSGSTGTPKLAKISDDGLVSNAVAILDYMPIDPHDIVPLTVPIIFVYGLSIFTTNCLRADTIICTNKSVMQKEFWSDFEKYKFSTISGVPYFYEVLQRLGFFRKEHPSLRYMTHTGGLMNENLIREIDAFNKLYKTQFILQYGQTEASGRMARLLSEELLAKGASIGKPIISGRFEIDQETSELLFIGPNIFGGYALNWEELSTFEQPEKLHTGDVGKMDDEGYYYIIGRIKRIMKLFGTRINLDEVELIIKNELAGITFICVGLDDKYLCVLHPPIAFDQECLFRVLQSKIGIHRGNVKLAEIHDVPLTPNGKIDYPTIKKRLEEKVPM